MSATSAIDGVQVFRRFSSPNSRQDGVIKAFMLEDALPERTLIFGDFAVYALPSIRLLLTSDCIFR